MFIIIFFGEELKNEKQTLWNLAMMNGKISAAKV